MNFLTEIYNYFIENNIPVLSFIGEKNESHQHNKLTEITIEINPKTTKKWQYFIAQVNSCGKIIEGYHNEEGSNLRFVFSGNNEPYMDSVLQKNAKFMLEKLQKKYYTVAPSRECFSVLVKPTHRCNLNCKYCYDKPFRDVITEDMPISVLDSLVKLLSEYTSSVQFIWHGGEPTMVGQDWFRKAQAEVFCKYPMLEFNFSFMSNGINLTPEWFDLFKELNIKAGMSYNAYFQDKLRPDNDGRAMNLEKTLEYSKEVNLPLGVIDVVTSMNYKNQIETYEYYKKKGIGVCLNHVFYTKETEKNNLELSAQDYSREFLKYFKHWLFDKDGLYERSAAEALGFVIGSTQASCAHQDCRYDWLGLNPLGEIYPCDRYFPKKYKVGNIKDFSSIEDIFQSSPYQMYCNEIQKRFDTKCKECGYWFACRGGCNGSACESTGSAEGTEKTICEFFRLNFIGVYDILRKVSIFDKNLNLYAKKLMVEHSFYSIKDIKAYITEVGVNFPLEYDKKDLLNCSEYDIFRGINFIKKNAEFGIHVDFIHSDKLKDIKINKEKHKKNFYIFLREVALQIAKNPNF